MPGAVWRESQGVRLDIVAAIAERISRARRDGEHAEMLPESLYPLWEEIYLVHDEVHRSLGRRDVGWKVGAASREVQQSEGMPEPIAGRIYEIGIHETGAVLGSELFIGYRLCESEFVLTVGVDLPEGTNPLTQEEVESAISVIQPGLEVGDMVFPDWYGTNPFWGACLDNAGGSQLVLGPAVDYDPSMDLAHSRMQLYCNQELVKEGEGIAAMGDPLASATWLINLRRARGDRVPAGSLLSTGTCTGHFFAKPGDQMRVDFELLPSVSATFGA